MAAPPEYDPNDPQRQPPNVYTGTPEEQRRWNQKRRTEEDDSLVEDVLDEVDEGFGCSQRLFGCAWQLVTLIPRLGWRVISEIFD